jgi:lysophospholipase L1-like esterase
MTYANGDNVFYIDNGDLFKDSEGTLDEKLMYDYLHFTKEGYELLSKGIVPTICELMDK